MLSQMSDYPKLESKDVRVVRQGGHGILRQLLAMQTPFGYRRVAELLRPEADGSYAALLYVHWYEPGSPNTSNRDQFGEEAREMVRAGAVCLLIETLWSDLDFFNKRTQEDDLRNSMEEVVNLRRAMDLLLSHPGVDSKRFAYVGHDFGGMYGVLAGSLDRRPSHYVVMAATPHFSDWYLYQPKLEGEAREAFIRQMAELDPITHVPNLAPAPVFFQFGTDDHHVPTERAEEFFARARDPKEMKWYEAGHGLSQAAAQDRKIWLKGKLGLE